MKNLSLKSLSLGLILATSLFACAQTKNMTTQKKEYKIAVAFTSICCGTASNDFLKDYVNNFCDKNKVKVAAFQKGGCGREGEYYIAFSLSEINTDLQGDFINKLEEIIPVVNEEIKKKEPNKGRVKLMKDFNLSALQHCRQELVTWDYNH